MNAGPTVLLVDDEAQILGALERLLRRDGYEVHKAAQADAALDLLRTKPVAVLICDQRMPGMSGAQVLAEARRISPETVRILLTGYGDLETLRAAVNAGQVSHLLLKPWDNEHLLAVVGEAARAYGANQERHYLFELAQQQKAELERLNQHLADEVRQRTAELRLQNEQLCSLQEELECSLDDTVAVLAGILEATQPNIALHSKRVAQVARILGERLALNAQDLRDLEFAARLHDIGKASRRYQLEAQNRRMRGGRQRDADPLSAESGHAILRRVRGFDCVARAVRHQGERHDGTGYPDGQKGAAIPLASRVIALANAYDEAAFADCSRVRCSPLDGERVLRAGQGKRFDPRLVDLLLESLNAAQTRETSLDEVELSPYQLDEGMILSRDVRNADGVLVLRAGVCLTAEQVAHIRRMSDADPLLNGLYVRCTAEPSTSRRAELPVGPAPEPPECALRASGAYPMGETPVPPGDTPRGQALVVDDDALVRSALARELRREGWGVVCAADGRVAQNILEENRFDLLLIDVAMPVMDGVALVAHVQQCWPDLPCVILTGHATREQLVRLTKAGNVVAVLAKPWDHERLFAVIDSVCGRAQVADPWEDSPGW